MIEKPKEVILFLPTEEIDCYSVFVQGPKYPIYLESNKISELGKRLAQHVCDLDHTYHYIVDTEGYLQRAYMMPNSLNLMNFIKHIEKKK